MLVAFIAWPLHLHRVPIFTVQPSRRERIYPCHTPARELTWEELDGGYETKFTKTTCKAPMTSPSCTASAASDLRHSPSTGCQAFTHSLAAGELPMKSASDQAGRKVLGCEGSRRQAGEVSVGINNFESQVFIPCLGSVLVSPVVSLALPGCKTTTANGKKLLPYLSSPVQHRAGIWAI